MNYVKNYIETLETKRHKIIGLLITYNEEKIIGKCLAQMSKICDNIIIVDSGSNDDTLKIANTFNTKVFHRKFDNYKNQRNYGLSLIDPFDWVLMLDADELLSDELITEIKNLTFNNAVAYKIKRVEIFLSKPLKYASENLYFPRLFICNKIKIERAVNEEYSFDGKVEKLKNHIHHESFNKDINEWLLKHVNYASREVDQMRIENTSNTIRGKIKRILYKSTFRRYLLFVYYFFIRLAFLDGRRGILYLRLKLNYEYTIDLIKWYRKSL